MNDSLDTRTLDRIAHIRDKVAEVLGIDPDGVPAYQINEQAGFYPSLDPNTLSAIERGDKAALAKTIDHTILKPEALPEQVSTLCNEALQHGFAAVCVNGAYVAQAADALVDNRVDLAAVVGFPLGQMATAAKAYEAKVAVNHGASEIDMVINVGWLKAGRWQPVFEDIQNVIRAAGVPVKVIIETALLTDDEKIVACWLARFACAAFVKTSTGFASGGATVRDVALMRAVVGDGAGVKASGGVKTTADALAMLKAGANRIGTSSGIAIVG